MNWYWWCLCGVGALFAGLLAAYLWAWIRMCKYDPLDGPRHFFGDSEEKRRR